MGKRDTHVWELESLSASPFPNPVAPVAGRLQGPKRRRERERERERKEERDGDKNKRYGGTQ